MSQVHYFIYRTIGESALAVKRIEESEGRKQLIYLQKTSMQMTLVSLSRIFDKKNRNKKFNVRCLETLSNECPGLPDNFPLKLDYYPDFKLLSLLANVIVPTSIDEKYQLILFYSIVLNSESVQNAVQT